jgi:hypothetical protein
MITYSHLGKNVEEYIEPARKLSSTQFSKIHASDSSEFDTERLKQNCGYVGPQDHKQELEPKGGTGSYVGGVITGIYIGNRYLGKGLLGSIGPGPKRRRQPPAGSEDDTRGTY